ncbi:glycoside hydrolase [Niastella yeongjuensis]|uniref:Glycoside hydrolase n=1 Tax=Niastella yeongjuensis TaxID=354355 RepID=A0A1V9DY25_9BACT|nr:beta-galactosidase GalB [Niastella yeongjuensis]OQP38776.1 glycoside hydrolase [Niastella yeongjuensis]SEO33081.1 beta-galactosidase [Niastella yeongjuensis]
MKRFFYILVFALLSSYIASAQRTVIDFNNNWKFWLGDTSIAKEPGYSDNDWRALNLPHDWSIEGEFSEKNPGTPNQAALPTGIGWYRKTFTLPATAAHQNVSIEFDGVYRNSEVWVNGHYLGKRPNGYISFGYDITQYIDSGAAQQVIAVKVDNSLQPNSRWYTGSGIYRSVRLVLTNKIAIDQWGTFITTPNISSSIAMVHIQSTINNNSGQLGHGSLNTYIYDASGKLVSKGYASLHGAPGWPTGKAAYTYTAAINKPILWSVENPYLYKAVTRVLVNGKVVDEYATQFGIRYFDFDVQKGFSLNGKPMKILGVCMHHDLGALGAAVNVRAMERQLQILKDMGCNAIRTSHNPPAPEWLDLCDKMGFLVMDEAFDMWHKKKNKFDYNIDFDQWHKQDLEDQVKRDRNHPSVIIWSIGNEIREQFDSTGIPLTKELVSIVKALDTTRPVTSALTETDTTKNFIYQANALDLMGMNYNQQLYPDFLQKYPGKKFLATETMSALASRGHYDLPADSMRFWPLKGQKFVENGNPDYTVSAYDNVAAYWGSTHEQTWRIIKQYEFLSGLFVWSGFDFLGEPVPYPWPARSSYYGIIDLAGFPKDAYYMYQSEWTSKTVLHLLPHWNWQSGREVDVWAYYNNADEVELYLNNRSLGIRKKQPLDFHVQWRVKYEPGTLKAVSRKNGKIVSTKTINTTGEPAKLEIVPDKRILHADGKDLSFITVRIVDKNGNLVPAADNKITIEIVGMGALAGMDNGYPASMESFKAASHKAYNGLCLAIIQSKAAAGSIQVKFTSPGLPPVNIVLQTQ